MSTEYGFLLYESNQSNVDVSIVAIIRMAEILILGMFFNFLIEYIISYFRQDNNDRIHSSEFRS